MRNTTHGPTRPTNLSHRHTSYRQEPHHNTSQAGSVDAICIDWAFGMYFLLLLHVYLLTRIDFRFYNSDNDHDDEWDGW